jgi:hypothetical protein
MGVAHTLAGATVQTRSRTGIMRPWENQVVEASITSRSS